MTSAGGDGTPIRAVVELSLDRDGRPVGAVGAAGGALVPFQGWLALMAELTRLAPRSREPGPEEVR